MTGIEFSDCVLLCHFVADQIEPKRHVMETFVPGASLQPAKKYAPSSTSPKYARGIGPHVDDYMRMEMEARKIKEMEHQVSVES